MDLKFYFHLLSDFSSTLHISSALSAFFSSVQIHWSCCFSSGISFRGCFSRSIGNFNIYIVTRGEMLSECTLSTLNPSKTIVREIQKSFNVQKELYFIVEPGSQRVTTLLVCYLPYLPRYVKISGCRLLFRTQLYYSRHY